MLYFDFVARVLTFVLFKKVTFPKRKCWEYCMLNRVELTIEFFKNDKMLKTDQSMKWWWWRWWFFLRNGWQTKGFKPHYQPGPLSEITTITNLWQAANKILTCTEPKFRLCWVQTEFGLCTSSVWHDGGTNGILKIQIVQGIFIGFSMA